MEKHERGLMTEGSIWKKIVFFSMPLLLGNVFQQLYNTMDFWVIGKFVHDTNAMAAVSNSGPMVGLLVSLFMGVALGAGVVIGRYYGAKSYEKCREAMQTVVAFGFLSSILLTALGLLLTPSILRWMKTPEEVMPFSLMYFRIFFAGISTTVMYNIGTGIFNAMGDSKHPLYFLIVSSFLNIGLNILFVVYCNMNVAGVALGTVLAQLVSAVLVYWMLCRLPEEIRFQFKGLHMNPKILKDIVVTGLPSGIQNSVVSLSNMVVQTNINVFGDVAMSGCGAYARLEGFALLPASSFSMALSAFVSQNVGAGKYDRVKKGTRFGAWLSVIVVEIIGIAVYSFAPSLVRIFHDDPQVVSFGVLQARTVVLFYCLLAFSHAMAGVLRGLGLSKVPMYTMLGFWCVLRICWNTFVAAPTGNIQLVFWSYPLTWTCSTVALLSYYLYKNKKYGIARMIRC